MKKTNLLLILLLSPLFSFAWDAAGHNTCGAIAYYYLKSSNPKVLAKVTEILKRHPWYTTPRWNDKLAGLTGEEKNVALFMLASTYPDDARGNPELGGGQKTKWHYVDYPFVPAGQTVTGKQPESPNAEEKLMEFLSSAGTQKDAAEQAIDLCWIFHLIEDIHQPLHTVSMYDNNHPNGDKGGNDTYISFVSSTKPVKLHGYWDRLIKANFENAPEKAQSLLRNPDYRESKLTELTSDPNVKDWISKESFVIAQQKVYMNGAINGTKENPTSVDETYALASQETAERRAVLAGIRLGKQLAKMFG